MSAFHCRKVDKHNARHEKDRSQNNISADRVMVDEDTPQNRQDRGRALNDGGDEKGHSPDARCLKEKSYTGNHSKEKHADRPG